MSAGTAAKLDRVDGELEAEDHAIIQAMNGRSVTITGSARFEGSVEVECDLECGSLESTDGIARINGSLVSHQWVDVDDALYVKGNLKSAKIEVGGRLSVGGALEAETAEVGGSLEVQGDALVGSVEVGGSFEVRGTARLKEFDVGGRVTLEGGEVTGRAEVGGTLISRKPLKFGEIDVGGTIELLGGEGESVQVGGSLRTAGGFNCRRIEVGGVLEAEGNLAGHEAEVGGTFRVTGSVALDGRLEVGGVVDVGKVLSAARLEVGGSFRAAKAVVAGGAEVGGNLETTEGLKAESVEIGTGASCYGVIVGAAVHIERSSKVQDVFCARLEAERGARMGSVFAQSVRLDDDCAVGRIVYTRELTEGSRVSHQAPSQKVDSLPPFPL